MNERIIILSLVIEFGLIHLAYKLFGRAGLYIATAVYTVLARKKSSAFSGAFFIKILRF